MVPASLYVGAHEVVTSPRLCLGYQEIEARMPGVRSTHLVVAVKLMSELLADAQVSLLAGLLGQALQLIDVAVAIVLEGKPAVGVEFPQSPGLVDSSDKKYLISV